MSYGIVPNQTEVSEYVIRDSYTVTTTVAANVTAYTFSIPQNASWSIRVIANAVLSTGGNSFNQCQITTISAALRRKTGNASITTISTVTNENFTTNTGITLDTSGTTGRLRVNSGGVQDVRWVFDILILKNN